MATHYAHSNFRKTVNEFGQPVEVIKPGDKITQTDIGVTDAEWEEYLDLGVISEEPYPDVPLNIAPAEYFTDLEARANAGTASEMEMKLLDAQPNPLVDEETLAANTEPKKASAQATKS